MGVNPAGAGMVDVAPLTVVVVVSVSVSVSVNVAVTVVVCVPIKELTSVVI